jgi:hypothetical protein
MVAVKLDDIPEECLVCEKVCEGVDKCNETYCIVAAVFEIIASSIVFAYLATVFVKFQLTSPKPLWSFRYQYAHIRSEFRTKD